MSDGVFEEQLGAKLGYYDGDGNIVSTTTGTWHWSKDGLTLSEHLRRITQDAPVVETPVIAPVESVETGDAA